MGRIISYSKAQTTVTLEAVLTRTASGAHTYTAVSLGAASADRYIAVCIGYISSATPATVTIGGVSAANVVSVVNSDSRGCNIWVANVPSGTTGDIVIAALAGTWRSDIVVYAVVGTNSAAPFATVTSNTAPISLTVSVPGGGCAIFASYFHVVTANAVTWTGATKDSDVFDTFSGLMTAASTTAAGTVAASIAANGTVTSASGAAASFF